MSAAFGPSLRPEAARLPGPRGLPLVGSLSDLRKGALAFYSRVAREHGPAASFRLGRRRFVLLSGPEVISEVLLHDVDGWEKGFGNEVLRPLIGSGLFLAEGEPWRARRRLLRPLFTREHVASLAAVVRDVVSSLRVRLDAQARGPTQPPGEAAIVDIHAEARDATLRIASRGVVGADVFAEAEDLGPALERLWQEIAFRLRWGGGWVASLPLPRNRRFTRDLTFVRRAIERAIQDHGRSATLDLIGVLGAGEAGIGREEIVGEILTFLLAGQECTSIAVAWTVWLLGRHEAIAAELSRRLRQAFPDGDINPSEVSRVPLVRCALREAMRLYPPAWMISRDATRPESIAGVAVPEGTVVLLFTYGLHRDPSIWPDPERFEPLRFAEGERHHRAAYLPFGAGPRTCIGMQLAMLQAETILATLYRRFDVTLAHDDIEPDPGLTLRPRGGVPVRLVRAA